MTTTYNFLLQQLAQAQAHITQAQSIANELCRDGMLTGECRLLGEQKAAIAYAEILVRQRADAERKVEQRT